ncbi:MAG: tetratricopeptide repeat protein [Thermoplasmata archaeon]|nr:tetratricopeptide repeat protein [Thermoplasmata archaeon]
MSSEAALRLRKPHERGGLWTSFSDSTKEISPRLGRINGQHKSRSRSLRDKALGNVVDSYNSGTVQLSKGNLEEAELLLTETISRHPTFEKAWNNLGVCLMRRRVHEEAIKCFSKALSIDPSYEIARLNLEECKILQTVEQL